LCVVIALLGYLVSPDSTPNANDQMPDVALKNPGFSIQVLKVRKNQEYENQNFLTTMFFGKTNPYRMVPINNFEFVGDSIVVEEYAGWDVEFNELIEGTPRNFHLADVVFPIDSQRFDGEKNIFTRLRFIRKRYV